VIFRFESPTDSAIDTLCIPLSAWRDTAGEEANPRGRGPPPIVAGRAKVPRPNDEICGGGDEQKADNLTANDLKAYEAWRKKPWSINDMNYERMPMLALRNYLSTEPPDEWPSPGQRGAPCG
jgi:hypothetical protein